MKGLGIKRDVFDEGLEEVLKEFEDYIESSGIVMKDSCHYKELISLVKSAYRYGVVTTLRCADPIK